MIKVLFSDVDRTILTSNYKLRSDVRNKLRELSSDIHVVLATARSPSGVKQIASSVGAEYVICFNGGWIGKPSETITLYEQPLDISLAHEIMKTAKKLGVSSLWYDRHSVSTLDQNELVRREGVITGEVVLEVDRIEDLHSSPFKIMCTRENFNDDGFNELRRIFSAECSITASNERLLEIAPQTTSKGGAAAWLVSYLEIPSINCAAVGDAENDISMLSWARFPLAVANATPECINLATFVAPSAEMGGMTHIVDWIYDTNDR